MGQFRTQQERLSEVFVKVIDGMLLRKIENVPTGSNNQPRLIVEITSIIVTSGSERVTY
ncbi:hypothetical protein EDB87DRAFT_1649772 [Lactarius vividus]|nr:hypothetical protein EDB87DRAFT_1649772 [Lactarius vividus]